MKKLIISIVSGLLVTTAIANPWVELSRTSDNDMMFYAKKDSIRIDKNDDDTPAVVMLGRTFTVSDGTVANLMWYVPLAHCRRNYGVIVTTDRDGVPIGSHKFTRGESIIATEIADAMCDWVANQVTKPTPKPAPKKPATQTSPKQNT